ncbi:MAG: PQQ-binding-like beta-propeller repeat protein [Rubripirellula sp.]
MQLSFVPVCRRVTFALIAAAMGVTSLAAADWPYWRGPSFDGTAEATGLPDDWDPEGGEGSNVLWKRDDIGGPCTPIAMNGRIYTIQRAEPSTDREGERVVCLDAATGETVWENRYNVWLSDVPAERVGWSSVVGDPDTGNVFVLGACDIFQCMDGDTGETLWSIPLHEQFGMLSTYGGRTNFPVIHEDLVIISGIIINWGDAAKPNHRLIAMNKETGEVVWFSGTRDLPFDTTYSAPSLVTIDGQRQLIIGAGDGAIWGFQPRTGKPLWHYNLSRRGIFATPLVVGNRVFASHSEENVAPNNNVMGAVVGLEVSGVGEDTQVKELWKQMEVVSGYSEPVLVDDRLYLVDDRCKMWIFDAATGDALLERKSFVGSRQRSALLHADGKIYVLTENGRWAVVEPTPGGFEVLNKGRVRNAGFAGSPIVADGRLYFPSSTGLFCVATEGSTQTPVVMSQSMGEEAPVSAHPTPTQLQIVPAETLVKPGEKVELKVHAFNALGQKLEDPTGVTFEVSGPGSIEGSTFIAPSDAAHTGSVITGKMGDITGTARIRIIPGLPWKFTFDDLTDPPLSWVGARYRHVIREVDGSSALTKITTIPKGARSRAWMGPSDLSEYTISADARGARMSDQLPDIGLTAHGYVLDLMGESQQLQIRTWSAQLRMATTIAFPWKEDTWYRMKFRVDIESEPPAAVAVLRGKVWPRDEDEPKEWTITARDESPNLASSPGLYGNAKVAELYLDNIEITANTDEP